MIKKLLGLAAAVALVSGVAACTSHKATTEEAAASAQAQENQETVVVAEAPAATFTKGEY